MIRISGVGERKLEKYGSVFLEEIRVFSQAIDTGILAQQARPEEFIKTPTLVPSIVPSPSASIDIPQTHKSAKASGEKVLSHQQTFILYQEGYFLKRHRESAKCYGTHSTATSREMRSRWTSNSLG